MPVMRRTFLLGSLATLVAACTPSLGTFNTLVPRDRGARRVAEAISYGDAPRQKLDIYSPTTRGDGLPVVIFIYGGSWASGERSHYAFAGAALAAQGFVTIIPDYRLVPEVRFPGFVEDCAAAVRWAQVHAADYGGDPSRIVVVGHSAGAYNAIMLALDARYLAAAGADIRALRGVVGLAGPYDFLPFDVAATRNAFGEAPEPQQTQPVTFARRDAPPLLLLWGDGDTTVGPRNLHSMETAMREVGGAVESRIYPGVNHVDIMLALSRPLRGRADTLADVSAFVRRVTA